MALHQRTHNESGVSARSFSRKLGPNELSYFLPSRANGLNDIFTRVVFRAPPALITPFRLQIVWAIIRIRHSLLACRIDMSPGCYDDARFVYTPALSPQDALEEAGRSLTIHDHQTGPQLDAVFISGSRQLSSRCLSRMDVVRRRDVSPGIDEFHMAFAVLHAITDGTSAHANTILTFLGGSSIPGGPPRTDDELLKILDDEWRTRWGSGRPSFEVIIPSAESRCPRVKSKFQMAAFKVDFMNIQRRAIGAHTFPRIPSHIMKQTVLEVEFDHAETASLLAQCQAKGVTLQNTVFALCNFAWIRISDDHPEINATKNLPMLFYTAISLRRHLAPLSPLASTMSLALGYGNIVLPAFIPTSANPRAIFWLRARSAHNQMRKQTQSPLLLGRAQILGAERARRAKEFARQDDEADGTLPPSNPQKHAQQPAAPSGGFPSVALMGISHLGDLGATYQRGRYPPIEFIDSVGHSRKAKGGILLFTRSAQGRFSMMLEWDAAAFPPGLVEEFYAHLVGQAHELILGDNRSYKL
ncbi:hypothetical protein R3P38DRAFT_2860260 [Favolaschia claudopus]|uniref:Alcohol acetyltransferase n=1 Tax=Favolaschia claudopus TaxID=2862362 RepID=A0AAW0DMD8_9AGAR